MAQQPVIWKKRILVPFWIVRILAMIFVIAIYAYALKVLRDQGTSREYPAMGVIIVFMLMIIGVLLLDVLAIILFLKDKLNPTVFLIMNSTQTGFWGGILILDLIAIARGANAVGIALTVGIFLSFVGLLIYAAVNYHRARKAAQRGHYAPAHNPAAPAPQSASYGHAAPTHHHDNPFSDNHGTAYHSQTQPVELQHNSLPEYVPPQHGAAADYYSHQPAKPAHMV
ncbi:hypothetical protein BS50DRAFT_569089 [Corynespora cassiicola Philippines]|uniref:MARVEL domain-containing protein n=1 Tax=Corynespora cassiicola Philippines TaxID=1448308 RepID=A0A2T2P797_CORCC|nr:hypothetical protein BS50DRAFT_569089 [Corynespora cassiicola Philippines]